MALNIQKTEYFNVRVKDHKGEGYKIFSAFSDVGISWYAYKAITIDNDNTMFKLFPDDSAKMAAGAEKAGVDLDGPHYAIIIKGSDEAGALADIYERLSHADIKLVESYGIADINDGYGVVIYLEKDECDKAMEALKE